MPTRMCCRSREHEQQGSLACQRPEEESSCYAATASTTNASNSTMVVLGVPVPRQDHEEQASKLVAFLVQY